MNVVILAGGLGTRISEYTKRIPKPMININNKPLLIHIMEHYAKYNFTNFYIALGYKGNVIRNYFKKKIFSKWNINLIDTGINTMTGGRLKRLEDYLRHDTFLLTYGDGVSDIDLNKLVKFHFKNKKIATLSAVRPPARFGAIKLKKNVVSYFKEKSKIDEGWVNGGFFVFEPKIFDFIKNDETFLEKEPLENISRKKQLMAYKHENFWQCVDTIRDKEILEKALKNKKF